MDQPPRETPEGAQSARYVTAANLLALECHDNSHGKAWFDHACSSDRQIPADVLADLGLLQPEENYARPYLWKVSDPALFVDRIEANVSNGPSYEIVLCALAFSYFYPDGEAFEFLVREGVLEPEKATERTMIGTFVQVPVPTARGKELEALTFTWPWAN